jgi:hypothetical protein
MDLIVILKMRFSEDLPHLCKASWPATRVVWRDLGEPSAPKGPRGPLRAS